MERNLILILLIHELYNTNNEKISENSTFTITPDGDMTLTAQYKTVEFIDYVDIDNKYERKDFNIVSDYINDFEYEDACKTAFGIKQKMNLKKFLMKFAEKVNIELTKVMEHSTDLRLISR